MGLAAAGVAAVTRRRTARAAFIPDADLPPLNIEVQRELQPRLKPKKTGIKVGDVKDVTFAIVPGMQDEKFCLGLVGTEYAGWGTYEFDPAELTLRWPEHIPWYREAELKHGRVAMLACA